jgi:lipopolysaccharide/colanic/teichoic acid biosynthesis glycosyltransferase
MEEKFLNGYYYFVARKEKEPTYDLHPTYGPFIKLGRTGKNGEIIKVYKFRTMHPYSEYLQEYVYNNHYLKEGGKFNNDFRISTFGKFLRQFWIDEIPMIINIFKGEMKLVGVRPLSIHYFSLYTEELQRKRIQVKPGLIPPYYADLPRTLDEIMESELRYLEQYQKHPLRTDIKYFFLAFYNIVFKNSRSN